MPKILIALIAGAAGALMTHFVWEPLSQPKVEPQPTAVESAPSSLTQLKAGLRPFVNALYVDTAIPGVKLRVMAWNDDPDSSYKKAESPERYDFALIVKGDMRTSFSTVRAEDIIPLLKQIGYDERSFRRDEK